MAGELAQWSSQRFRQELSSPHLLVMSRSLPTPPPRGAHLELKHSINGVVTKKATVTIAPSTPPPFPSNADTWRHRALPQQRPPVPPGPLAIAQNVFCEVEGVGDAVGLLTTKPPHTHCSSLASPALQGVNRGISPLQEVGMGSGSSPETGGTQEGPPEPSAPNTLRTTP